MASNSGRRAVAACGRKLLSHSHNNLSFLSASAPPLRRSMHGSAYDKNMEDGVCPAVVPDDIITPLSDKYWAPNPRTGVFGPPTTAANAGVDPTGFYTAPLNDTSESVLEEKAFFRPVENLDLPELRN